MHWSDKYIGSSYDTWNCAEFVAHVAKHEYGHDVVLPNKIGRFLRAQQRKIKKHMYDYVMALPISEPEEGCVALMHGRKESCHIGITTFINNIPYVVHSMTGCNQVVRHKASDLEKYTLKVEGYYKWLK